MIKQKPQLPNSTSEYFTQLLSSTQLQNSQQQPHPHHSTQALHIAQSTYHQIIQGFFQVKSTPDSIQQIIPRPKSKSVCNNGNNIDEIDKKIKQNQQILKQAKREMMIHKKQQYQAYRLEHQIKVQENQEKLRQWAEKQRLYQQRRVELARKRELEIQRLQQLQKQQLQKQKQKQLQQRKQSLQTRLKTLSQSRQRRKHLYQQTLQQSKHIPQPKYKQIEKQFSKLRTEQQLERQAIKKNKKIDRRVDFDRIRQHEREYMERLEEKLRQKEGKYNHIDEEEKQLMESRFKSLLKRSQQQVEKQKHKLQRRLSYQSRLKQLEISTDDDKRIKIEIQRDKARNVFKYNFLRQKNFTDEQIFKEFKDFVMDANGYQLGKGYLKEARKIGQEERMKKSRSEAGMSMTNSRLPSERYTNYLPEIKARRSQTNGSMKKLLTPRDIQQAAQRMGNTQKTMEKISKSLKKYDDTILNKKLQLESLKMVSSTIRKEREIDELYMKSLKAKLACLEISSK